MKNLIQRYGWEIVKIRSQAVYPVMFFFNSGPDVYLKDPIGES